MYNAASESISRWKDAIQNDLEARVDWSVTSNYSEANHHTNAILNGETGRGVLEVSASSGSSVELSAAGSSDPDGDSPSYSRWFYSEPSSYSGSVSIQNSNSESATVTVPSDAGGEIIHIVPEVVDGGSPNLTADRRVIINVN